MATAFVLSGGANLGAVQVGMLRALREAGIRPDMLVGASVGAVNAAWLAGADPNDGVDELAHIWTSLRRGDVFPVRFGLGLAGFLGRRASLIDSGGLRRLIRSHIRFERLEDAPIQLHVVVTDVLDGRDVVDWIRRRGDHGQRSDSGCLPAGRRWWPHRHGWRRREQRAGVPRR